MTIHRFIGNFSLKAGQYNITDQETIHQIWDVLKLRPGEIVELCDGQSNQARAEITERNNFGIVVELGEIEKNKNEPTRKIILACAILKKENFELVCQKATEVGASEIVPIITDRTVKLNLRYDRLEKIIKEAAEQSGRGTIPQLHQAEDFSEAVNRSYKNKFLFDFSGRPVSTNTFSDLEEAALFIGPEGGWTPKELEQASENNFRILNLGPRVLRGETAAIIAAYLATL